MADFSISYGQLEQLLMQVHDVPAEKRGAFGGRIRHFQRLGLAETMKTGKGRRAHYGAEEIMLLALAFELTQFGVSPDRCVTIIRQNYSAIVDAVRAAVYWARARLAEEPSDLFLYFDPSALSPNQVDAGQPFDVASETFAYEGWRHLRQKLDDWAETGLTKRVALLNLSTLIFEDLGRTLAGLGIGQDKFDDALHEWTEEVLRKRGELPAWR